MTARKTVETWLSNNVRVLRTAVADRPSQIEAALRHVEVRVAGIDVLTPLARLAAARIASHVIRPKPEPAQRKRKARGPKET